MTTIKRFGLAVVVLGLIAGASGRVSAGLVTYFTENSAFGAGDAARSNANHTIAFSGGNNDVTITFNAVLASSPTSVNNALPVALGTFTITETGNSNVGQAQQSLRASNQPDVADVRLRDGSGVDRRVVPGATIAIIARSTSPAPRSSSVR